jgi:hypothetical protein
LARVQCRISRHAAETGYARLAKNADFAARIDGLKLAAAESALATAREVLKELTRIGLANMAGYSWPKLRSRDRISRDQTVTRFGRPVRCQRSGDHAVRAAAVNLKGERPRNGRSPIRRVETDQRVLAAIAGEPTISRTNHIFGESDLIPA